MASLLRFRQEQQPQLPKSHQPSEPAPASPTNSCEAAAACPAGMSPCLHPGSHRNHGSQQQQQQQQQHQHQPPPTFMSLPPELHLLISQELMYPDALSLKHTSRYFYYMVDTGVHLKVDWLLQRRKLHLDCPNNKRCELGSDLRFCRGSVRLLMQRRREHMECESRPGLGCLVYGTRVCTHRRTWAERWRQWMRRRLTIELWWLLLALLPLVLGWLWLRGA